MFIDFAKAFDAISHDLLLKHMSLSGLTTSSLYLLKLLSSGRHQEVAVNGNQQEVAVNGKQSEANSVIPGVPQRSV